MTETARELVQRMVEAGEWPDPKLLDEIVARGQEAVEPLLEVLRTEPHGWPAEAPLDHALVVLGALQPPEALQPITDLFRTYHNETAETLGEVLAGYGPAAFEPALAIVRDPTLRYYARAMASNVVQSAAGTDPERRARAAAVFRELLADHLARAPEASEADEDADEDEDEDEDGAWDESDQF